MTVLARFLQGWVCKFFVFVRFAIISFAYNFGFCLWERIAGLILDTICTPGGGQDLQA